MTYVLLGSNMLLAVALLLFVREARGRWASIDLGRELVAAEQRDQNTRLDAVEPRVTNCEIRLDAYHQQFKRLIDDLGWTDDKAWTRVLTPAERKRPRRD